MLCCRDEIPVHNLKKHEYFNLKDWFVGQFFCFKRDGKSFVSVLISPHRLESGITLIILLLPRKWIFSKMFYFSMFCLNLTKATSFVSTPSSLSQVIVKLVVIVVISHCNWKMLSKLFCLKLQVDTEPNRCLCKSESKHFGTDANTDMLGHVSISDWVGNHRGNQENGCYILSCKMCQTESMAAKTDNMWGADQTLNIAFITVCIVSLLWAV